MISVIGSLYNLQWALGLNALKKMFFFEEQGSTSGEWHITSVDIA